MNFDSTAGGCLGGGGGGGGGGVGGRKIHLILLSFLNITVVNGVLCKTLDTMRGEMKQKIPHHLSGVSHHLFE